MDVADLKEYVGDRSGGSFVQDCWDQATALVEDHVSDQQVPETIKDRAILEVGAELYNRREAPNGISQFADLQGQGVRVARDPMVAARPLLAPYVLGGIG